MDRSRRCPSGSVGATTRSTSTWPTRPGARCASRQRAGRSCRTRRFGSAEPPACTPSPSPSRAGRSTCSDRSSTSQATTTGCLLVATIIAMFVPDMPYPVLEITGEQGSAKTTIVRMIRALIDPNVAPVRAAPRDSRDIVIAASNSWVVGLDNLSHIDARLSDDLCRLATGGGWPPGSCTPTPTRRSSTCGARRSWTGSPTT